MRKGTVYHLNQLVPALFSGESKDQTSLWLFLLICFCLNITDFFKMPFTN